jgi:heptosyltransferase-2
MTRSLFIAPQWIGDAIMSEPLLRSLHMRGEVVTVAALPWVAPVFRAMNAVAAVIELPFQHGGLQWAARGGLGAVGWHPSAGRLPGRGALGCC